MKNLEDKPFALVGVNTNRYDVKKLKEVMDKEKLNWRSFADPAGKDGDQGSISKQFNLVGTPTLYVLDHKGVIRHKWLGSPGEKAIDAAIDKLLKEAQGGSK
ncbi:MAG: TlpA disulfide reductase family protein [Gemmataceae bacterium]